MLAREEREREQVMQTGHTRTGEEKEKHLHQQDISIPGERKRDVISLSRIRVNYGYMCLEVKGKERRCLFRNTFPLNVPSL